MPQSGCSGWRVEAVQRGRAWERCRPQSGCSGWRVEAVLRGRGACRRQFACSGWRAEAVQRGRGRSRACTCLKVVGVEKDAAAHVALEARFEVTCLRLRLALEVRDEGAVPMGQ
eukprot:781809-Prymnesium_polylepis.1